MFDTVNDYAVNWERISQNAETKNLAQIHHNKTCVKMLTLKVRRNLYIVTNKTIEQGSLISQHIFYE